jgi:signal transduction histidine kinase
VRVPVAESWRRSRAAGVVPAGTSAPTATDRAEALTYWEVHPLREAAPLIGRSLGELARQSDHLIVVSDAAGVLLQLEGDPVVRSRAADSMNFTEGALWSEDGAGTNAVGTALAEDHAVQVFATEHFVEVVQAWTCSAAPVHDPDTGELLGVIDLTGLQKDVRPQSLAAVVATARAVEGHLARRLREHETRLRARFGHRVGYRGERRAVVTPTGRLIADDARGWLLDARVDLPPGGGELVLPSGARAVAEPLGSDDAFVLREVDRAPGRLPHNQLHVLADEQDALRRLATAVARNVRPAEIFTAVAEEIRPLLGADDCAVVRFEPDATATIVAALGGSVDDLGDDARLELDGHLAIGRVFLTGRSARVDGADYLRRTGLWSAVASPIVVADRVWGAIVVSNCCQPLPPEAEERMSNFTELVGLVIANAETRAELSASRARVVAAADEARRGLRRDLHDGAQQRLVSAVLALKMARQELGGDGISSAMELLDEALAHANDAVEALRELAHGILPAALARDGLRGGIGTLVSRVRLPLTVDVTTERLPGPVEATAYFIVAEAVTNTVKHARARSAHIAAVVDGGLLRLVVRDDGVGGARYDGSSGLLGLRDRAAAVNGRLHIVSPPGGGTVVTATLPIPAAAAESSTARR